MESNSGEADCWFGPDLKEKNGASEILHGEERTGHFLPFGSLNVADFGGGLTGLGHPHQTEVSEDWRTLSGRAV
mgnify:FL=1